jgi:hypothetical protein
MIVEKERNQKLYGDSNTNPNEITLKDLFIKIKNLISYLLVNWKSILIISIFGAVLGYVYAVVNKPIYSALTTFVLEENSNAGMSQYASLASMVGIDIGGGGGGIFQGDNIIELYKSRKMIQAALLKNIKEDNKNKLLIDRYIKFNHLRDKWAKSKTPALQNINFILSEGKEFNRTQDSILGKIVDDITLNYLSVGKPDKKLSIIHVEVKAKDEVFAKEFADNIVQTVNNFYVETKAHKASQNLTLLQHQTDSVKAVMTGAIYRTASITDATPNLNPTRQVLRVSAQGSQFNAESNKAILTQLVQNLELAKITLRKETPLIQIIDDPVYPLKVNKTSKVLGIIAGFIIAGALTSMVLLARRFFKNILD